MTIGNTSVLKALVQEISRHKVAAGVVVIAISTGLWAATDAVTTDRALPVGQATTIPAADSTTLDGESAQNGAKATLEEALEFGTRAHAALSSVADYTAAFTKTELIDGKLTTQIMDVKCRSRPFSVYLGNRRRGGIGREVIYVAGANDGNLLVHESGLKAVIGTLQFKPDCRKVMETNRHPITDVGLVRLIESAMAVWENDQREADSALVDVQFFQDVKVGEAVCDEVQVTHRKQYPKIGYQIGRVYVEKRTGFPVQGELYGWPSRPGEEPPLLERYTYSEIETNVGLTARDFDPQNSAYAFVSRD